MAQIDEPVLRNFVKDEIRPIFELLRALRFRAIAVKTKYNSQINIGAFAAGANGDTIVENRTAEGILDLTKLEINQTIGLIDALIAMNEEIVSKPCVRSLQVS